MYDDYVVKLTVYINYMNPIDKVKEMEKRIYFAENQDIAGFEDIKTLKDQTNNLQTKTNQLEINLETSHNELTANLNSAKTDLTNKINTVNADLTTDIQEINIRTLAYNSHITELENITEEHSTTLENQANTMADIQAWQQLQQSSMANVYGIVTNNTDRIVELESKIPGIDSHYASINTALSSYLQTQNQHAQEIQELDDKIVLTQANINLNSVKIADLENNLSNLESTFVDFDPSTINQDIDNLQTQLTNCQNNITEQTNSINELENSLETTNSTLNSLQTTVNSNTISVNNALSRLTDAETDIILSQNNILNNQNSIISINNNMEILNNRIDNLSSSQGGNISLINLKKYDNFDEVKALNYIVDEPIFWTTENYSEKRYFDSRSSTGPCGKLLTRVSPFTQFKGKIRVYFDIPLDENNEEILSTTGTFFINGVGDEEDLTLFSSTSHEYALEFSFDIFSQGAFCEFKFQLNDARFADISLQYLEIVVEKATNFLLLSRDDSVVYDTFIFNKVLKSDVVFHKPENFRWADISGIYLNPTFPENQDINGDFTGDGHIRLLRYMHKFGPKMMFQVPLMIFVAGDDDTLYYSKDKNVNNNIFLIDNVFDVWYAKYTLYNNLDCTFVIVTNDYQLNIGQIGPSETSTNKKHIQPLKMNTTEFPSEFCGFIPIQTMNYSAIPKYTSLGFLLQHISGHIFYILNEEPEFMIDLGIGSEPNAIMSDDFLTLNVFYRKQNNIIKTTLIRESTDSEDWKIAIQKEIIPNTTLIYMGNTNSQFRKDADGDWHLVSI